MNATTPFIRVSQHYKTRRWHYDCPLLDEAHIKRALANAATITRSTHPVSEILKISPPVSLPFGFDEIKIIQPKNGGDFYSIEGRTVEILATHKTKPWK